MLYGSSSRTLNTLSRTLNTLHAPILTKNTLPSNITVLKNTLAKTSSTEDFQQAYPIY